jgi:hypothetical protein
MRLVFATLWLIIFLFSVWPICYRVIVIANFYQSLASYFLATLFMASHTLAWQSVGQKPNNKLQKTSKNLKKKTIEKLKSKKITNGNFHPQDFDIYMI